MQIRNTDYDSTQHSQFKALSINQPYAKHIADEIKTIEVRTRKLNYRGDIVICSTKKPVLEDNGFISGAVLCIVELYDVVKFKDLTRVEKIKTKIPENQWKQYNGHYGWKLRNVRKIIEKPVTGGQGLWTLYCTPYYIMEYPEELGERKLTPAEQVRAFGDEAKKIKQRAKKGLFLLAVGLIGAGALIFAIIKLIIYLANRF